MLLELRVGALELLIHVKLGVLHTHVWVVERCCIGDLVCQHGMYRALFVIADHPSANSVTLNLVNREFHLDVSARKTLFNRTADVWLLIVVEVAGHFRVSATT